MRDDWVTIKQAMERVGRSRSTIYNWIRGGSVRTMRPLRVLWIYLPDVIRAEAQMKPGRPRAEMPSPAPKPNPKPISYMGAHKRLERERGPAKDHPCEFCAQPAHHWSYKGNSAQEIRGPHSKRQPAETAWSPDPRDYRPLCASCHRVYDGLARMPAAVVSGLLSRLIKGD